MSDGRGARFGPRRPPIRNFIRTALAGDDAGAAAIALDYLGVRGSRTDVDIDLLYGAQRQIDELWHVGEATANDELAVAHAVEVAMEELAAAAPAVTRAEPKRRVLLATVDPEPHDIGLRMVAVALQAEGWTVDVLPRATPGEAEERVNRVHYDLAGLSMSWDSADLRLRIREVVQLLRARGIPVLLGGAAVDRQPQVAVFVTPDAAPVDARQAVTVAYRLLRHQAAPGV